MFFKKNDDFKGEISFVLPDTFLSRVKKFPLIKQLYATNIGFYPRAKYHFRRRMEGDEYGSKQNILLLCVNGKGWLSFDEKHRIPVEHMNAVIIPKNTPHLYEADLDDPWTIYWSHFLGDDEIHFLSQLHQGRNVFSVSDHSFQETVSLFQDIFAILAKGYSLQKMIAVSAIMKHIMAELFFNNENFHPSLETKQNQRINQSIEFMLENLSENLTLNEIAEKIGLSSSHYTQIFKHKTHFSPIEYFINLKIQKACHLLLTSQLKVYEICEQLGYEDQYYFSRIFKKVMGVSPNHYRNNPQG